MIAPALRAAAEPASDPLGTMALVEAASFDDGTVLAALRSAPGGLSAAEAAARRDRFGPNAISTHRASLAGVAMRQLRSPLLMLLVAAAIASYFVGERGDAVIIGVIVGLSVGLGIVNEYRAERAGEALHAQISRTAVVLRDGVPTQVAVTDLVPGDVVELRLGDIVPADVRIVQADALECEESILTGESLPVPKRVQPVAAHSPMAELTSCALMGTIVHSGSGRGLVVATGSSTAFGAIARGLTTRQLDTEFQAGLRRFSMLLVRVAAVLTTGIFAANIVLHRPVIDALLFSLAIAVGITPQLLPAVVSISLASGSRQLRKQRVLVKRLVCIEDLGDIDTLFTDKTGTLTMGHIHFMRAVPVGTHRSADVVLGGLLAADIDPGQAVASAGIGGNALDQALWQSPAATDSAQRVAQWTRLGSVPFDHERCLSSALVAGTDGVRRFVVKGAPENVFARCVDIPADAAAALQREFEAGNRVVAVAERPGDGLTSATPADESGLTLVGLLVFLDPPKPDAADALARLDTLGVRVKIVTGDSGVVAARVCAELGLTDAVVRTGAEIDSMDDAALAADIDTTTVFARVSPEQKARIVRVQRRSGGDVAFLGDGVNDALALHAADVGISVDTATDVAKDAADVILLDKDLHVLADGVSAGRRIFANTMKYVLMGTSSNFGNMFSAAGASLFLSFLPMLPSQILLNNMLYDTSQLAIPSDSVDEEQLVRPSHWDVAFIRRFMLIFGPISSLFDFATFGVMLGIFHAHAAEFRTGWFVESLATQTLVIFVIRTRRVPFVRSRPGYTLTLCALATVALGAVLPLTPLAHPLGFRALPLSFYGALAAMLVVYLLLVEAAKAMFFARAGRPVRPVQPLLRRRLRHHRRRAAAFVVVTPARGAARRRR